MKKHSFKKRRNASIIEFSPKFMQAVEKIRENLGIPRKGFANTCDRDKWHRIHYEENGETIDTHLPQYYWHFPKELVELIESFSCSSVPSRVNYHPEVPLDRHAMELLLKFDLPEEMVNQIKAFILGAKGLSQVGSELQPIVMSIDEGVEGEKYIALIAGIDKDTTKKEWLELWGKLVLIMRLSAARGRSNKRPIDAILMRDLSFWTMKRAGKKTGEIIGEWQKKHLEDEELGEDTVGKAINRIDRIMKGND